MEPKLIPGGMVVDDRGWLSYINSMPFGKVKRIYMVGAHKQGFVRAWHGHQKEAKFVMAVKGTSLVGIVSVDDWHEPQNTNVLTYSLSDRTPEVLYIPPGYANGFKNLTEDAQLLFFSTATLQESEQDDFRFPAEQWNIWNEQWR
jgi:dTDP-4-dehydrorhamnose 3,5-epimerase-like enzyme